MSWIINLVITVIALILILFFKDFYQDKIELRNQTLDQKFQVIVKLLNDTVFNGMGIITRMDKREFHLSQLGRKQIFIFFYGTGHLTIKWKNTHFQKEIVFEKTFDNVRHISDATQKRIGEIMINSAEQLIETYKQHLNN